MNVSSVIVGALVRFRWPLFLFGGVVALLAVPLSSRVAFDQSIENMFAADDPLLKDYRSLKSTFGGNEVVLAVYSDAKLFSDDGDGLARLSTIRARCEQVRGVRAAFSIDQPLRMLGRTGASSARVREAFENYTHGSDGTAAAIVCMLEPETSDAAGSRQQTIEDLRKVIRELPDGLAPGVLAGEPIMVLDGFRLLDRDGRRLGWWSSVLLAVTILVCFRSLRWVLIPIAVVQWALLSTRAVLVLSGLRLSMVSSMLTAIVTVVGVATVVHVIVRFREGRALQLSPEDSLRRAGRLLVGPIFWACATDAVGFLALLTASVGPIQDFGTMMAVGSLFVLPAVALLLPAMTLAGRFAAVEPSWGEKGLATWLEDCLAALRRNPRWVLGGTLVATCIALAGTHRLRVETDFSKNFRADSQVVSSYRYVEDKLGGAGVFDVVLPAPESLDGAYLQRIAILQKRLNEELVDEESPGSGQLTKVLSLTDALAIVSPHNLEQAPSLGTDLLLRTLLRVLRGQMPEFYEALYAADAEQPEGHSFRIMLRAYESQSADEKLALIERVREICAEEFPAQDTSQAPKVTGFFVLLANLVSSVLNDQWKTFGLAILGIGLMLSCALRSPTYALLVLIPNTLPTVFVLGALGWAGGRVNMGVAMIAAVSLGLSVDSAIHYVTFYRRARAAGRSRTEAISEVQGTVGRAVVLSTLALVIGFSVLASSDFIPTVYFGVLVSLSMLGGLLGNLVLLPVLLTLFRK